MTKLVHSGRLNPRVTVSALPDDVLLEVFGFCVDEEDDYGCDQVHQDKWLTLVHVCRRWRCVVFSSPRSLDLRLYCTPNTPVKKTLDIWPELPVVIYSFNRGPRLPGVTNIMAALKQRNRVCKICIDGIPNSLLKKFAAMSTPFPALTDLELLSTDENPPILPDSFLGGSAPLLRDLGLYGVPFPALPKLLLSATNLVSLRVWQLPHSGYMSPDAIVAGLSALTKLESLFFESGPPRYHANQQIRLPPPLTRVVLPALTEISFTGDTKYLEDTVSRIDTPLLCEVDITFSNQLAFNTPSLSHFISRTELFKAPHRAHMIFSRLHVTVKLFHQNEVTDHRKFQLGISCDPLGWRPPSLVQMYNSSFPPFPTLEHLRIYEDQRAPLQWQDYTGSAQWIALFHSFTSVKDLELSKNFVGFVAPALGRLIGQQITEVLPALQTIYLDGPQSSDTTTIHPAILQFVAARYSFGSHVGVQYQGRGN